MNKKSYFKEILFTEKQIKEKVSQLAEQINSCYSENQELICIGILKGCLPFLSDLTKLLKMHVNINYIQASSFMGEITARAKGRIDIRSFVNLSDIENKDVLIVDEICDTGRSLEEVKKYLLMNKAKSVKIVVLIKRDNNSDLFTKLNWYGWEVPTGFLIGYGLDYKNCFRSLSYIGFANKDKLKEFSEELDKWKK